MCSRDGAKLAGDWTNTRGNFGPLYLIWLLPDRHGHAPGYGQKAVPRRGPARRVAGAATPDGRDGSLTIRQDASVLVADIAGPPLAYTFAPGRHAGRR